MSSGFHRMGANVEGKDLAGLVQRANEAFERLPPEQQAAHRRAQKESWVRGEMAMGSDADEAKERDRLLNGQSPLSPRDMGYTGNVCSSCGGVRMMVAGHCEVCADCGTTTGCS